MKILIIGAGNTGSQVARQLTEERHDVVIIDSDQHALDQVESQLDVLTVCANGSSPYTLSEVEIEKFHICISVTGSDETNIVAGFFAHNAGVGHCIVRLKNTEYIHRHNKLNLSEMGIDLVINQKHECAIEIASILSIPCAMEVFDIFSGKTAIAGFKLAGGSNIVGRELEDFLDRKLAGALRMIAVLRDEKVIIPHGDTVFEKGDIIYVVGRHGVLADFAERICVRHKPIKKVIIAGGGDLGLMLAREIEDEFECVLLEKDKERAEFCSTELHKTLILRGDALSETTLQEAGITGNTAFVALTGDDENNLMNCLMARQQGVIFTSTQVNRTDYIPIIRKLNFLNHIINPSISTTHAIMHYLRSQKIKIATLLHNMPGELFDVVVSENSKLVGKNISDINLPKDAIIASILRDDEVITATGDVVLQVADRLIIFAQYNMAKKIQSVFV